MKYYHSILVCFLMLFFSCEEINLVAALETEICIAMKSIPLKKETPAQQVYDSIARRNGACLTANE